MELTNDFRVPVPVETAWSLLTDLERIAPCMPGAELQEVDGEEYRGVVKVKVGPITAQYKGAARFTRLDVAAREAVIRAEGRETRGQGNATATITASLSGDGDGTSVHVVTDLNVTGKVAQFGRGVLADVSSRLLDQFVTCLEADVLQAEPPALETVAAPPANGSDPPAPKPAAEGPRRIESRPAEPVDLLETAGAPVARRVAPILALVGLTWLWRRARRRARRRRREAQG